MESVESFRLRARAWLAEHMPRLPPSAPTVDRAEDDATWVRDRELQRMLWDGGFAGICFPKEYGGLGLTIEHQHAFTEESLPYEMPVHLNVPNFSILGGDARRLRHPRAEGRVPPDDPQGRAPVGAVPLRTHRWLRPRRVRDPRRPRRRRVGAQRLEDLEHRGDVGDPRDVPRPHRLERAEAPRPHHVHRGDPPARRPGRSDQAGQRLARVLPGVLRRRACSRRTRSSAT